MSGDKPGRSPPKPRLLQEVITVRKLPRGVVRLNGGVSVRLSAELRRHIARMGREIRGRRA